MNETRPPMDSIALHALARRGRSQLMAQLVRRLTHWIARELRGPLPAAARAAAR